MKFLLMALLVISSIIATSSQIVFEDDVTNIPKDVHVIASEDEDRYSELKKPNARRNNINRSNCFGTDVGVGNDDEMLESTTQQLGQGKRKAWRGSRKCGQGQRGPVHRGRGRWENRGMTRRHEATDEAGVGTVKKVVEEGREPQQSRWQRRRQQKQQRREQRRERRQRRKLSTTQVPVVEGLDFVEGHEFAIE